MARFFLPLVPLLLATCQEPTTLSAPLAAVVAQTGVTPLMDTDSTGRYLGFPLGRYPDGEAIPASHDSAGRQSARLVTALDANGNPSAAGRIVFMSIGMSIPTIEWCQGADITTCQSTETFMVKARDDSTIRGTPLKFVDGAKGKQTLPFWDQPSDVQYDWVKTQRLAPRGLAEKQVQAAWMKIVNADPTISLPAANADAYAIVASYGKVLRALRVRYPNLRVVFLSSRSYAGYATGTTDPEPYAYEQGLAVKWVVAAQIRQRDTGVVDSLAGDLGPAVAPWIGWGPDLWANGSTPRSDGLFWVPSDFKVDGIHPVPQGIAKVVPRLIAFFKTSPQSRCWFLAAQPVC